MDIESVPETLGMRWEYTIDGMLVPYNAPHTHCFTPRED